MRMLILYVQHRHSAILLVSKSSGHYCVHHSSLETEARREAMDQTNKQTNKMIVLGGKWNLDSDL